MKRKIDDILKERINDIEIKEYINLEILQNDKKSKKIKYFKLVACLVSITIVTTSIITFKLKENTDFAGLNKNINASIEENNNLTANNQMNSDIESNKNIIELPQITEELNLEDASYAYYGEVENVLAVEIQEIEESTCYSEFKKSYSYPITKIKAKVLKDFIGNYNSDMVEFYIFGGTVKISDYENIILDELVEYYGFNEMTAEEKQNTYVDVYLPFVREQVEAIKGESYIVSLNYDKTRYDSLRIVPNVECNFKFYNQNTGEFKNSSDKWVIPTEKDFETIARTSDYQKP